MHLPQLEALLNVLLVQTLIGPIQILDRQALDENHLLQVFEVVLAKLVSLLFRRVFN